MSIFFLKYFCLNIETTGNNIIRPVFTIYQSKSINIAVQNLLNEKSIRHLKVNQKKLVVGNLSRIDL
ncbi:MAG: hypothetical protein CMH73_06730 [Nitrospina sp.]|nr:hypothetical protein [Nitrospina sp.]